MENIEKIKEGMTIEEVEKIIGKAGNVSDWENELVEFVVEN